MRPCLASVAANVLHCLVDDQPIKLFPRTAVDVTLAVGDPSS